MFFRTFRGSLIVSAFSLVAAFLYGGFTGSGSFLAAAVACLVLTAILGVLEFTFSFDNAVVNAKYLVRLDDRWRRWFLTWGMVIAVFGMRFFFPLVVVGLTAKLWPWDALKLAFAGGDAHTPGTYAYELHLAHPAIASFGGIFLLMIVLDWLFEEREISWLTWLERPLARIGKLDQISVVIALIALAVTASLVGDEARTVLSSGIIGLVLYLAVNAVGSVIESAQEDAEEAGEEPSVALAAAGQVVAQTGRAALFTVLFLEILDASFSFDGVIGAFAITSDPVVIALGLGLIGAMFVRSLTIYLVRKGTLGEYVYLEHGAHWSIGVLAIILLSSIKHEAPEVVTGLIGVTFIAAAYLSSKVHNKRAAATVELPAQRDADTDEAATVA